MHNLTHLCGKMSSAGIQAMCNRCFRSIPILVAVQCVASKSPLSSDGIKFSLYFVWCEMFIRRVCSLCEIHTTTKHLFCRAHLATSAPTHTLTHTRTIINDEVMLKIFDHIILPLVHPEPSNCDDLAIHTGILMEFMLTTFS